MRNSLYSIDFQYYINMFAKIIFFYYTTKHYIYFYSINFVFYNILVFLSILFYKNITK